MPRPSIPEDVLDEAARLRAEGTSWARIARATHYSVKGLKAALERRGYKHPTRAEYEVALQAQRAERTAEAIRLTVTEALTPVEVAARLEVDPVTVRRYLGSRLGQRLHRAALKEIEAEGALTGGAWRFDPARRVQIWVPEVAA